MKKFFQSLYLSKYFLAFIVIFAYLESIQIRFYFSKSFRWFLFTPDAAIGQLINAMLLFVIIGLVIRRFEEKLTLSHALSVFTISLFVYVIGNNVLAFLISLSFNTLARNFNFNSLVSSNIKYVIDVFVYGGFFLAHYYFHKNQEDKEKISELEKAQIESQLSKLKAQLDPHFLFNNLNVLDQLIEEDKEKASGFLNDFSEIYRYVLKASERKLVSLEEEFHFAQHYFRLMQQKFGDAYRLHVSGQFPTNAFLPPLSLQLLLENAIEHNIGTEKSPVEIELVFEEKSLQISNTRKPKKLPKLDGGRGLENLKAQYQLFGEANPSIEKTEEKFAIRLPYLFNDAY